MDRRPGPDPAALRAAARLRVAASTLASVKRRADAAQANVAKAVGGSATAVDREMVRALRSAARASDEAQRAVSQLATEFERPR